MRGLVALVAAVLLAGCFTDEDGARKTLDALGFEDIQLQGYDPFACGKGDVSSTKFTATNPRGKRVSGVVCCGFTKGCTARF